VRCVCESGEENHRPAGTAPIENLEANVVIGFYEPDLVRRGVAPDR
jgi:hypothetical protein